jgi:alpha-beta hydrolase superfamily lysophospholipase
MSGRSYAALIRGGEEQMHRFTSFDGTTIAYDHWEGEAGPVLLHHGFAADARINWVAPGIVDRLQQAGFEVVALDARGHGRSERSHDPGR